MLVLTRKTGEKIKIGENIYVSILEISKSGVRIGIEAPREVSILRHEVYERIQEENQKAARKALKGIDQVVDLWRSKKDRKE
ncbi:MAG: carbon storage regulator CsrA [Proteobacteria bacterium]|nr:carbon storage regulator CsrA [Pseudomonadota bacterium]